MTKGNLTLLDELVLLGLRDGTALSVSTPLFVSHLVMAGAILLELELRGLVDSDPGSQDIYTTNAATPTDPILADAMNWLAAKGRVPVRDAISWLARQGREYRALTLRNLMSRGIIGVERGKLFWIIATTRYPTLQAEPQLSVKARISHALYSDEIADPRDAAIVSLAHASGLLHYLFRREELDSLAPRLARMRQFELICRVVDEIAADIELDRSAFVGYPHM